jgi:hypothetical protein
MDITVGSFIPGLFNMLSSFSLILMEFHSFALTSWPPDMPPMMNLSCYVWQKPAR